MDFSELIGTAAELFGGREILEQLTGGGERKPPGANPDAEGPYVYERWLTRPRDPSVNDR